MGIPGVRVCCEPREDCNEKSHPGVALWRISSHAGCVKAQLYATTELLRAGIGVMFSDADVVWYKPPSAYVVDAEKGIHAEMFMDDQFPFDLSISGHLCVDQVNIGTYMARPSALPVFNAFWKALGAAPTVWDQRAFDCVLRECPDDLDAFKVGAPPKYSFRAP